MKGLDFPIIGTLDSSQSSSAGKIFDLSSPAGRKVYFEAKIGDEIAHLKKYLEKGNFFAFLVGKKNSGKGTYAKLFTEIFGEDKAIHLSVGDLVREVHANWDTFSKSPDYAKLKKLYGGYISFDEAVKILHGRSTATLLPTEFVLALLKVRLAGFGGKSVFLDGLPREIDQVSYSLFFRDLAGYTEAPDLFILIDVPEAVIDERIKYRVVCPICKTSRNTKLFVTSRAEYDAKNKEFYLVCDNTDCKGARMEKKEGDELGIETIRPRLVKDEQIIKDVFSLHGIPKILLTNSVPVAEVQKYFKKYEITPEYSFKWDEKAKKVKIIEKPWTIKDDNGVESYSLLAAPVMVSLIKQLVEVL
jgi:adenylate kinase family enzyme